MEIRNSTFTEAFKMLLSTMHGCKWLISWWQSCWAWQCFTLTLGRVVWGVSPYLPTNVLLTRPAPLFAHNFELNFDGVWNTPLSGKVAHAHWRCLRSESCKKVEKGSTWFLNLKVFSKDMWNSSLSDLKYSNFKAPSNILQTSTTSEMKRMLNFGFQKVYANSGRIAGEFWLISRQM